MAIFITSDTHFGHKKDFLYEPRGFTNIYEHDAQIIKNWNEIISMEDDVYHLGDVMLNDTEYGLRCLKQLKGKIHIICGNHDTDAKIDLYKQCWNVVEVIYAKRLKYGKYNFFLSHYPCLCGNYDEEKPLKTRCISLCGHTHTKDKFVDWGKGLIYHCELDAHNCTPICLDSIIEECKDKYAITGR